MKSKSASLKLAIGLFAIAVFIAYMNYLTPLFADDFSYSVSFITKKRLTSVQDLFQSQYIHYFTTNGRTVVHTLAQALLWIGKPTLNVINGVAFSAFCLLICYHGLGTLKKVNIYYLMTVFAALWFLTPHFGGSYLWVMGAANYLYSPIIILCFLIPYRRALSKPADSESRHPVWASAGNAVFGICAGWTNENTSLALIVIVALVIAERFVNKKRVFPWMWTGLAGSIIGCAFLFLSPAQAKRLAAAGGFGEITQWLWRFLSISKNVIRYLWLPLLVFAVALFLFVKNERKSGQRSLADSLSRLAPAIIFTLGTGISVYSMVGSPEFPVWIWSSILAFALISVINMVSVTEIRFIKGKRLIRALLIPAIIAAVALNYAAISPELHRIDDAYLEREQYIENSTDSDLIVEPITTNCTFSSYSLFSELSTDPDVWPNTAVANYYGLNSISAVPNDLSRR